MTIRKKSIQNLLKARDYELGILYDQLEIIDIEDKLTEFSTEKNPTTTFATCIAKGEEKSVCIVLNSLSKDFMIDEFGEDDKNWLNRKVKLEIRCDETTLNTKSFVLTK